MKKRKRNIVIWILMICVLGLAAVISTHYNAEIDLSKDKVYSLSPVTKKLLADNGKSIVITYYVSPELKSFSTLPDRIISFIEEYDTAGGPLVESRAVEVQSGETGMLIEQLGLIPQIFGSVDGNRQTALSAFSGIVIESTSRMTSVPFVFDMGVIEYEVTSGIKRILSEEKKQIGIMIADSSRTIEQHYSLLTRFLLSIYSVRQVTLGTSIPEDIETLIVLGQQDITPEDADSIDAYLKNGGTALFCIDPVYVDLDDNLSAEPAANTALHELLVRYGIRTEENLIIDSSMKQLRIPVAAEQTGETVWRNLGPYPFWISMQQENIHTDHPVTARFQGLDLLWCSPLSIHEVPGLSYTVLARSTADAWLIDRPYQTQPGETHFSIRDRAVGSGPFPTAVSVQGKLTENQDSMTKVVVIGDADSASDLMEYSDSMHNVLFFAGAVNWLTLEEELLTLLENSNRTLDLKNDLEQRVRFILLLNIFVIPLAIMLFGAVRYGRENKKKG
jgi:ABC-type uncharacterized transport system involved in gliding motility auxiliary subunit